MVAGRQGDFQATLDFVLRLLKPKSCRETWGMNAALLWRILEKEGVFSYFVLADAGAGGHCLQPAAVYRAVVRAAAAAPRSHQTKVERVPTAGPILRAAAAAWPRGGCVSDAIRQRVLEAMGVDSFLSSLGLQVVCIQLDDTVQFRWHWPLMSDLRINGQSYRVYSRTANTKIGNNQRDDVANIGIMCSSGKRVFRVGVKGIVEVVMVSTHSDPSRQRPLRRPLFAPLSNCSLTLSQLATRSRWSAATTGSLWSACSWRASGRSQRSRE